MLPTMPERRLDEVPWWEIRRAQNLKPATYRCPLCGQRLPALSEHMLMLPEGRPAGRRHAHTECVLAARRAGRLPSRREWRAAQAQAEAQAQAQAQAPQRAGGWRARLARWRGR
jgi:hypothetical protein